MDTDRKDLEQLELTFLAWVAIAREHRVNTVGAGA